MSQPSNKRIIDFKGFKNGGIKIIVFKHAVQVSQHSSTILLLLWAGLEIAQLPCCSAILLSHLYLFVVEQIP
jgi:hypothetical protein